MKATYETALNAGIPIISTGTAAKIMAVLYVHGNNEFMVYSPKFNVEREYIQKRFKMEGGAIPDPNFIKALKEHVKSLQEYEKKNSNKPYPEWAKKLFKERYGVELIN